MKTEKKYSFKLGFLFVVMLLVTSNLVAQGYMIEGPSTATAGETKTYELLDADNDQPIANIYDTSDWYFSWESLAGNSFTGYGVSDISGFNITSVNVLLNQSDFIEVGIIDDSGDYYYADLGISVQAATAPTTPSTPTISSQSCNSATLQKSGNPPSGVTWYWQGTNSAGTSISYNAVNTYAVSATGTYYLRARNTAGTWSTSVASVVVTLGTIGCSSTFSLSDENYVYTIAPQVPTTSIPDSPNTNDYIKSVTYFDGLGRTKQQVAIRQSASQKDIITHIEYNAFGQVDKQYLPYVPTVSGNEGMFRSQDTALSGTNSYYATNYGTLNPYSEKTIEASPLGRVLEQAAPGNDWKKSNTLLSKGYSNGHTIKFEYDTNIASEVRSFSVSTNLVSNTNTYEPSLVDAGVFAAKTLHKTITKDENWLSTQSYLYDHTTEEFKNKSGQVVLKRTYSTNTPHDTYYVYDDYGNLTYVIPPKVTTASVSSTELLALCYQYKYDHRNRLVEKKIPGKGWEYIVYDNLDRPVLTQDANQRKINSNMSTDTWLFTKYDVLGRVAYTGMYNDADNRSRPSMQIHFDTQNNTASKYYEQRMPSALDYDNTYYSNTHFPTANIEILTINYYDDYAFYLAGSAPPQSVPAIYGSVTSNTKGLATGSKVKVLGTTNYWISTISYYDNTARPIYVYSKNDFLETTDIVQTKLDFVGKVDETTTSHTKSNGNHGIQLVKDVFSYDHAGRLLTQTQYLNNAPTGEIIASNTYDEVGQLNSKQVGGKETDADGLQTVNYTYNVRGWLTDINDVSNLGSDLFAFRLNYNEIDAAYGGEQLYNGNIGQTIWKTSNDNKLRAYGYTYDGLNRIKGAVYKATSENDRYNLSNISYDKNGNIERLTRKGHINSGFTTFGTMDDIYYYYNGNQLHSVTDNGNVSYGFKDGNASDNIYSGGNGNDDFKYDVNGNMVKDANKGITHIAYNHLNLPTTVTINGQNISYTYDATGAKLCKVVNNITTDYAGNYIYNNNALQFFNTAEGYFNVMSTNGNVSGKYVYQYKDHLGNVRLSYSDRNNDGDIDVTTDPNTNELVEESNYYPFGLKHKGYNNIRNGGNSTAQKFGYNGVELEESLGLNLMEMDVRSYDPAIARWTGIDPITHHDFSPYQAFDNNPVFFADPSGADSIYNFDTNQYVINGKQVTQAEATEYANNGGNSDGSNNNKVDEDCCGWQSYLTGKIAGFLSSSKKTVTNESITSFLGGLRDSSKQGLDDGIDEIIQFINNDIISGEFYLKGANGFFSNIANGESFFFNASPEYVFGLGQNISNMSANDWAYAISNQIPASALMFGAGAGFSSLRFGFSFPKIKFNHQFVRIKNGFVHKKPFFRFQYSSGDPINPLTGRGYSGTMDSGPHINIDFGRYRTHTFFNPRKWDALSTNKYSPFRYSKK